MTLSGWTRLWIVVAVIWWGAGAVWLTQAEYPLFEWKERDPNSFKYKMPSFVFDSTDLCTATFPSEYYASKADCLAKFEEGWRSSWSQWFKDSWRFWTMPLVIFGPLVLGGLMLGVGWIRKGFQSPAAEKDSPPNPSDSA